MDTMPPDNEDDREFAPAEEVVYRLDIVIDALDTIERIIANSTDLVIPDADRRRMRAISDRMSRNADDLFDLATAVAHLQTAIKGGPGTGKSVVAINLVAELSAVGYNAQHATGSKAFTETIRKVVGNRAAAQFRYFNTYGGAERDAIDVLILDEAHRLRPNSNNQYTQRRNAPPSRRSRS